MKTLFIFGILIALGVSTFTTTTECTCAQLLSQGDCIKQSTIGCSWDSTKKLCAKGTSTPVTPTTTYTTYCEQFNSTDCPTKSGCQWLTTKCSHFTGCTAFAKTTDADCQIISNKCITDGVHCVEKSTCSSYMKQLPCVINASGSLCYWDNSATPNACVDATKCEQLPLTLLTDTDCRAKISTCTAKTGGGCQDSGANCADQTTQLQCFWNKLQSQSCFWNGTACVDRICTNALATLTTDDACKTYLSSCTTKSGGGCVTRAACSAATNQESCKTNSSGGLCYWNSANACVDKNCAAAPTTYTTNKQCSDFVTGCITKKDGGCKSNGACSAVDVAAACSTNSTGGLCVWSSTNTCVDKICTNAPSTNTSHDLCTAFMPSCTVNTTQNGCRTRTCDNATTDYDTNDKCNTYLTGCITKTGGGCVVNTTCLAIGSLEKACLKDANGNACIFDSSCKDKTCENAPSSNNTHALCQTYMNTCTVNLANNGCIDMTCENIHSSDNCSKDKSNNVCVWKGTCYKKHCKQAASTITAYSDCTNFMASCTVDNDGSGCMDKPPQCSGILTSAGCVANSSGGACGWSSNKCQDQTCATAPSTTGTTSDCNTYKAGCIVNNNSNGCIDPTTTACNARTLADNCNASAGPICLWDPTATPSCIAISCATASQTSITTANGHISDGFSNSSCNTYLTGCIVNNESTGCIAKGTSCSSYSEANCGQGLANGSACYWNTGDSQCVDKQCQLIKKATHEDCQTAFSSCTYGNGTVCAAKQESCVGYTQNQCHTTSTDKNCVWANNACRDITCSDAANNDAYDTHTECNMYISTCTVIDKVDNTGCVSLATNCSDYTSSAQCVVDASGTNCFWNYDQCILLSAKTCTILRLSSYTTANCEGVISSCKQNADSTGCTDKGCADYTSNCSNFDYTCMANSAGNACFVKPANCAGQAQDHCIQANDGLCHWGSACAVATCTDLTSNCFNIANCIANVAGNACFSRPANCAGQTQDHCVEANDGICHWGTACAVATCTDLTSNCTSISNCIANVAGNACFVKPANCAGQIQDHCVQANDGQCSWSSSSCAVNSGPPPPSKACSDKTALTNLTFNFCDTYLNTCSVKLNGTACIIKSAACTDYEIQENCRKSTAGFCKWDSTANGGSGGCVGMSPVVCTHIVAASGLTYAICQDFDSTCTVNVAGTFCLVNGACAEFEDQNNCYRGTDGLCFWNNSACKAIASEADCGIVIGSGLTDNNCQYYNLGCYPNKDGTACQSRVAACSSYQTNIACTYTSLGPTQQQPTKCFWNTSACIGITPTTCGNVVGSGLTDDNCQSYNTACYKNKDGTACQSRGATCSTYQTSLTCTLLLDGSTKCYYYTPPTGSASCMLISSASDCSKVTGSGLTFDGCQAYNTACAVNAGGTACEAKSCTNKPAGDGFDDAHCSGYVPTCTANSLATPTACVSAPANCSGFTTSDTCIRATEGVCVWVAGVVANTGNCVKKTCSTAAISTDFNSHAKCNAYLSTCTVASVGGCTATGACNTYKSKTQCEANSCFWNNRLNFGCVNASCDVVETSYNSHDLCSKTNLGCTVKANLQGCMALASTCGGYTIQDQCHKTSGFKSCVWITSGSGNICQLMSCSTADSLHTTHQSCYDYINFEGATYADRCTVAIVNVGGTSTPQGCQQITTCSSYTQSDNCQIDNQGNDCVWNSTSNTCAVKSCATAPATDDYNSDDECRVYMSDHSCTVDTSGSGCMIRPAKSCATAPATDDYNSDDECRAYMSDHSCTVDTSGSGCMIRPAKCDGMTQAQCVTNYAGGACEWFQEKCVDKACETAPDTATDADKCNTYLAGCTMDPVNKCLIQICEDFIFTTDSDCQKAKAGCTSNGTNCVSRTVCQVAVQAGCVTQSDGSQCQWVTPSNTCVLKTCQTAPATTDFATESQCAAYFTGCTTKSGNGCTVKSTCANANVAAACTTASDGTKCVWDTNKCRNIDCQDYSGTTYAECQAKGTNCTAGLNGKCIQLSNCEAVVTRAACVYGLNGPCLWIAQYNNGAGACFAHNSCKSRSWNLDSQCKMISDQCTTNGSNCLAITSCAETNTTGGCKTGYDGNCIQTVSSLGSTDPAVCKIYNACSDAFYTTHNDCQNASVKCTTNGTTSCAPLGACSSYTIEEACKINDKAGPTVDATTGGITVTGICKWDTTAATPSCRDQVCSDLTGLTHYACYVQLSTCTSDGTNCLTKGACASYKNQPACENGYGSDGPQGECFWEAASTTNNTANCRVMKCSDIASGTTTAVCQASLSSCVSDGTVCIAQDKCSTYKAQTSCNSHGTDGICVFAASTATGAVAGGTCTLMSSCASANNDTNACASAKDRCSWIPSSGSGATAIASKCATHTCASFATTNPTIGCTNFLSWDKGTQQVCTTVKGVCTETDPSTLTVDSCYSISGYTFTWSTSTSKCSICTNVVVNTNNNITTSNTTTDSGYILGLSSILLGYLMF